MDLELLVAELCLLCKHLDIGITNQCKFGLDTSPDRTDFEKHEAI